MPEIKVDEGSHVAGALEHTARMSLHNAAPSQDLTGDPGAMCERSLKRLFDATPIATESALEQVSAADFLASIRDLRSRWLEQHRACMERSTRALAESLEALRKPVGGWVQPVAPVVPVVPVLPDEIAAGPPPRDEIEMLSRAQWLIYFAAEVSARFPEVPVSRAYAMGARLHSMASHLTPEFAAMSLIAGLDPGTLH